MEEFKKYKFGDIVNILDSKRIPLSATQRENRKGIYPYYGAQGIIDYIDDYIFDGTYLLIAEDGENLKSQKNNIAQIAIGKYWVNNHAHIVESNGSCDIRYICYLLNKIDISGYITGSAQPKLNQANLQSIELSLPSLTVQKRIADYIDLFDSKISLNRRINDNLEQQAQALFKSWFVDFEPFKDGKFVESEMGMIPEGWKVVQLGEIIEISKRFINPQKNPDKIFYHYSLPACDNGLIPEIQSGKDIMSNKIILQNNTILFSKLNPRIKRIWFACDVLNDSICSTEFIPYRAKNERESVYIYSIINSDSFYASVLGCVNGATGSHQRFHAEDTLGLLFPYKKDIVDKYIDLVKPVLTEIHKLRIENKTLALTRDSLLPRLMSGELKINDLNC